MNDFENSMRMEIASTGNYGADYDTVNIRRCPCCKAGSPDYVYENEDGDIIGCTECLTKKDIYNGYDEKQWEEKKNV